MQKIATFLAFYGFSCGILRLFLHFTGFSAEKCNFSRILRDFLRNSAAHFCSYLGKCGFLRYSADFHKTFLLTWNTWKDNKNSHIHSALGFIWLPSVPWLANAKGVVHEINAWCWAPRFGCTGGHVQLRTKFELKMLARITENSNFKSHDMHRKVSYSLSWRFWNRSWKKILKFYDHLSPKLQKVQIHNKSLPLFSKVRT